MRVLLEGFYGGSHAQLIDLIRRPGDHVLTLPAKKWHWRLVSSAASYFAREAPRVPPEASATLFVTSMVNLAEFLALRPDYARAGVKKVYYFHENQLAYPTRQKDAQKRQERDFQYGWAQIVSAQCADHVLFNSDFNRRSFLDAIDGHLRVLPADQRPPRGALAEELGRKAAVLYFPLGRGVAGGAGGERGECDVADARAGVQEVRRDERYRLEEREAWADQGEREERPLHILWAHRWEHDKGPEVFLSIIDRLAVAGHNFVVSVMGEAFGQVPPCFETFRCSSSPGADRIVQWGFAPSREEYEAVLRAADVSVSTSFHEFFGVGMLESVLLGGCYPLVPKRLVYVPSTQHGGRGDRRLVFMGSTGDCDASDVGGVLSASLPLCLSASLPLCLSASLPLCLSASLPLCLSASHCYLCISRLHTLTHTTHHTPHTHMHPCSPGTQSCIRVSACTTPTNSCINALPTFASVPIACAGAPLPSPTK
jgi:glycosyltransferase involved in cell wall biosynthesis